MRTQLFGAVGAFALAASMLVAPAVGNADDDHVCDAVPSSCVVCSDNTVWNSGLNQCVMAGPGFADPTGPVQSGEQPIPCAPAPGKPCG